MKPCISHEELFGTERPVALITGSGADRVGRVIARRLAENRYRVVLHAHHSVEEAEGVVTQWRDEGLEVSLVCGPVDDQQQITNWIEQILSQHGGIHALVNSAAVWEPSKLEELDAAALTDQWRVNVLGPALLCRAVGLAMAAQSHGGGIVNIGDWAVRRPYPDFAAYMLSKGSIRTLTEVMAVELAQRHRSIRVNAVLPGPVLMGAGIDTTARKKIVQQSLLRREGTAEDVASAVQFLLESPFITGVCLPVDGGRSIHAGTCQDVIAHPTYEPN